MMAAKFSIHFARTSSLTNGITISLYIFFFRNGLETGLIILPVYSNCVHRVLRYYHCRTATSAIRVFIAVPSVPDALTDSSGQPQEILVPMGSNPGPLAP